MRRYEALKKKKLETGEELSLVLIVAQFIRCYGADAYLNPAWPTADHIIPFRLFWALYAQMHSVFAWDRLNHAQATAHGIGIALSEDGAKNVTERELDQAFPMRTNGDAS